MKKNSLVFFRNDDVRETLDDSLIKITKLCVENKAPISHTVEPANVSLEVAGWLLDIKNKFPDYIEIVQHGYSHSLNYEKIIGGKLKKGEFGGDRTYQEQFNEIIEGKELMDKYFGNYWFPLFTFPYGARNDATLKAVSDAGFRAVNGSFGVSFNHKMLYFIGRLLQKEMLWGRKISYNLRYRKKFNLFQIDTSISVIKKYVNENTEATFYSLDELKKKTLKYLKNSSTVGIVLHHRYHNTPAKIKLIEDYIQWLKKLPDVKFVTQEYIYKKFSKK